MFWNLKESSVEVGKSRVDYAVFGNGKKPMVIIPGLSLRDVKGAGFGLALMYRTFARDYRVYVIDKKNDIEENCTVSDLANDTAIVMQALGIENAYVLGVSLGGMIAEVLAIEYPTLVKRLVLGVTASRTNETMRRVVGNWISLAEEGDFAAIVRDMLSVMYSKKYVKQYGWMFPILAKLSKPKNEERFIRLAKACLTCEAYDKLEKIEAPTLVLGGADDRIVTAEASREIAERLSCEIYMYEGLGHSAYEEAGDFNLRIKNFFE
ncbi:MAG: alpha/beta hydrolase [Clostridia bacterium]|nr:alpha/beta hydrolase [Clostridia bacterium]